MILHGHKFLNEVKKILGGIGKAISILDEEKLHYYLDLSSKINYSDYTIVNAVKKLELARKANISINKSLETLKYVDMANALSLADASGLDLPNVKKVYKYVHMKPSDLIKIRLDLALNKTGDIDLAIKLSIKLKAILYKQSTNDYQISK